MEVRWRSGARFQHIKAKDAYDELESIKQENGGEITPQTVLNRARNSANKLHKAFEWDDTKAAHRFRLNQAMNLIKGIHVVREDKALDEGVAIYHNVTRSSSADETKTVYMDIEDIMSDPIARDDLLRRAINEAVSFRKKYYALSEIAKIHAAIEETLTDVDLDV